MSKFYEENSFMSYILKNESIVEELSSIGDKIGIVQYDVEHSVEEFNKKSNTSVRKKYASYYDEVSRKLVEKKEKFIIEKFNYEF
jgi:hypothetical protein